MQKLRFTFLFIFLGWCHSLTGKAVLPSDSVFTYYRPQHNFFVFNVKQWTPRDTGLNQIQCYQPFLKENQPTIFLGNNGLAGRYLVPTTETELGFRLENNVFDPYFLNSKNTLYYDTKRPFTSITYLQGAKKEQFLDIVHAQNLSPRINAGFNYRRTKSDGFFAHQNTSYNNVRIFSSGRSKDSRFCYITNFYTNRLVAYENWGVDTTGFEQIGFGNKSLLSVLNTSAQNNRSLSGGYLKTYFLFKQNSSDSAKDYKYRIFSEGSLTRTIRKYQDFNANPNFYGNLYNDSTFTLDTTVFQNTSLAFGLESNPEQIKASPFWWNLKWISEWFEVYSFYKTGIIKNNTRAAKYTGGLQDLNNIINANIQLNLNEQSVYSAACNFQYVLFGYNSGDRLISIHNHFKPLSFRSTNINFNINHSRRRADYFQERFFGNSVRFFNDTLLKVDRTQFSLAINNINRPLKFGVNYWLLDNFIFFSDSLTPKQQTRTKTVNTIFIEKSFSYKKFNWRLWASYNQTNFLELRLPKTIVKTSVYIESRIFKRTTLNQVGFDLTYLSKTGGISYHPELGQFYVSNTQTLFNYPFIDFFWNVKISTFRAFIKIDHLNAGLTGNRYYVAARYPYYDRAIRLGIIWVFHY